MAPELSCYTTALVEHLGGRAAERLANAVHLWVRTDSPDQALAFSHHDRIDDGALVYRHCDRWGEARDALADQLGREGSVIVVGNAFHLPWSPHHGVRAVPHWLLLRAHRERGWRVVDPFHALTPGGEQRPYDGWLDDDGLHRAMTPVQRLEPPVFNRDVHALGTATDPGALDGYRWLWTGEPSPPAWPGTWLRDPVEVLTYLRDRFVTDGDVLEQHTDDLWAAARHHSHRRAAHPASASADAWSRLPKALRFAADSARRGRRRTGVVSQAFDSLIDITTRTEVRHARP
ncbi:hypothetical protein [Streptomyces sp. SID5643]|uniref:hypothetical protein n=1 Tax=Streptomyces sp. SID5643 TaxID=2690307 RepID=UPI00136F93A9|nr:hypothetical protein [Streptomyces sp. SID5643]MZF84754.1 hypothetical protein [Streptomyces sp. SID5643]